MRAAVYGRYGPPEVVAIREVPTPVPRDHEVLIRVRATTVSSGDWRARSLVMPAGFGPLARPVFGFTGPRQPILGTELAGEVAAAGKAVTAFKVGDEVFAYPGSRLGGHAEFRCMSQDGPVALKPAGLSWEEAAALSFGGTTALHFLTAGKVQRGETILVNGASGAVGSAAVQLARHLGAEVTAVCGPANVELVRSLGAGRVIDYTREDFTQDGVRYDVIMDTAGTAPFRRARNALTPTGRLLTVLGGLWDLLMIPWFALTTRRKIVAGPQPERAEDLRAVAALAAAGHWKPVIDRVYPFEEIVAAHARVDTGHKRGSVVIRIAPA